MTNHDHIFSTDLEVPAIVRQKAEKAFEQIKTEDKRIMKKNKNTGSFFRNHAAAAAICICVLAAGSITVAAAVHHYWSRGMQGTIQASGEEQLELKQEGIATVLEETPDYSELAVTSGNITITPETVIADEKFAYVSFQVKGYSLGQDVEPGFERVNAYIENELNPQDINMSASFYDGIVADETASPIYEDGTPIQHNEEGLTIPHYADAEGNLEYVVMVSVSDYTDSLLGKSLHIDFENLGTVYKAEYTGALEGRWNFTIDLPGSKSTDTVIVGKTIEETCFVLQSFDISPISIQLNFAVNGEVNIKEGENGVPDFCGVVLKDGTRLPYLSNGGMTGYQDETMSSAYVLSTFDRVIDVEQIAALLVSAKPGSDMIEIEIE